MFRRKKKEAHKEPNIPVTPENMRRLVHIAKLKAFDEICDNVRKAAQKGFNSCTVYYHEHYPDDMLVERFKARGFEIDLSYNALRRWKIIW